MASINSKYAGIPSLTVAGSDWFKMEFAKLSAKLLVVELIIHEHPGSQRRKITRKTMIDNLCALLNGWSGRCRLLKLCKPTNPVDYKMVRNSRLGGCLLYCWISQSYNDKVANEYVLQSKFFCNIPL
jgi:hypothetical protein